MFFLRIFLLVSMLGVLATACGHDESPTGLEVPDSEDGNSSRAQGFTFTRTQAGRVEWEIRAKEAVYTEDRKTAEFTEIEAFFYPEGAGSLRLAGTRGRLHTDTQDVELDGGVRLISSKGYTLTTDHVKYTQSDRTIRTDAQVFIRGEGMAMSSVGMTIAIEDERLEFLSEVKSTLWNVDVLKQAAK